jgi:hypothetical protein
MPNNVISRLNDRLAAAGAVNKFLNTKFYLPAAVFWNRLEGRPRSDDLARPLRAEVRDPAWMLARQWQFGEFEGEDAGAPILARLLVESTALASMSVPGGAAFAYDPNTPIEFLAERQTVTPDLVSGLYLGRRWLRQLVDAFGAADPILESFRAAYPVASPADGASDLESLKTNTYPKERALRRALAGRSLDGVALLADIRQAAAPSAQFASRGVAIVAGREPTLDGLATALAAWFDAQFGNPGAGPDGWQPTRLEYNFALSATEPDATRTQLLADRFPGGRVDWYSFDTAPAPAVQGVPAAAPDKTVRTFVPTPAAFFGMPNIRWWEFEDNRVGFGITTASKTDLVKMLLAEFGLVFGNDWFLIPLRVETGRLFDAKGIVVSDNFGFNTLVEPVAKRQLSGNWSMWTLSRRDAPGEVDARFFLAPALEPSLESNPVDQTVFLRDETANLVWGVETIIPDPLGGGRDAYLAATQLTQAIVAAFSPAPAGPDELADVPLRYQLMGSVPENWIPLVAVKLEIAASSLLQGAMPRIPAIEPALDAAGNPILSNNVVLPRGTILARDPRTNPNLIHEEEVLRDGIVVRRTFRRARWNSGKTFAWSALRKQSGRGEGSSGLAFDQAIDKTSQGNVTPPSGLVSWWKAEGDAADATGLNNGTIEGSVSFVTGRVGEAFQFSNTGDVMVPDSPSLRPAAVTVMAWVKNSTFPGPNNYIVSKGANQCSAASYALYTSASTQNLIFGVYDGVNGAQSPDSGPGGVWDGNWHFVAGTYDGSYVRLYVDGVEVGAGTPTNLIINYSLPTNSAFYIGRYVAPQWCTLGFNGSIDEVRVFNRALSASEILAIYQSTP